MDFRFFSIILTVVLVFLISVAVHFPYINYPKQYTDQEIQYLLLIENYFHHTCFKLNQPPFSNLFYSLILNLQYNNIFPMNNKIQFNILLRIIPALFSSLILPIITTILILYDVPISTSFLCGAILAFEPSLSALNRFFNPNSFFYFFSVLTILFSKISEMNIFNSSRYFVLKHIESILFAISICSDSSGIVLFIILVLQYSQKGKDSHNNSTSDIKSKISSFIKSFKYHFIYSAILFNISIFIHLYLISNPSNNTPIYSQFFSSIFNILVPASPSEIFTIQKLQNIHITKYIQILNNPAILFLIYIGIFISIYYRETIYSIPAFISLFLSFRFKEELLWKTPLLFILCILSFGIATKNLSRLITNLILIPIFCCSLLFYVILFSKSYGGRIVL